MEDVVVRRRYPHHSVPVRKNRKVSRGDSNLSKILLRQFLACFIILAVVFLVKSVNTPVAKFLSSNIQNMLKQNIELKSIYESIDNIIVKLKNNDIFKAVNANSGKKADDAALADDTKESNDTNNVDNTNKTQDETNTGESGVLSATSEEYQEEEPKFITPASGPLSSSFGERVDPVSKILKVHQGIDIAAAKGSDILAALDGTVINAGNSTTFGKFVKLKHEGGFETIYAHCSEVDVKTGQQVKQGDVIGKVGNTGAAVGVHLHFEIWKDGKAEDPLGYISISQQ